MEVGDLGRCGDMLVRTDRILGEGKVREGVVNRYFRLEKVRSFLYDRRVCSCGYS